MSLWAALVQVGSFYRDGEWLLFGINVVILVAGSWVLVEAILAMLAARRGEKEPEDEELLTEEQRLPLR